MKLILAYFLIIARMSLVVMAILALAGLMTYCQNQYKASQPTYAYQIWVNGSHYYTNEYAVDEQGKLTFRSEDGYVLEFYQPNNLTIAHKEALPNVK